MTAALLKTKLFIPPLRPNLVPRPRLIEDLNHGQQLGHKLTLVSAPAGFGKSTLVSEWIDCCQLWEEQFRSLPVTIASARAYLAQASGDAPGSVKYSRLALDLLPEGDHLERGRAAVLLGVAQWTNGDLEAAHHSFAGAMASFQMAGNILYAISFTFILDEIKRRFVDGTDNSLIQAPRIRSRT